MNKICVTGANGFIGKSVCKTLSCSGKITKGFVRTLNPSLNLLGIQYVPVGDISLSIDWKNHLMNYNSIIHCAGIAHSMDQKHGSDAYSLVNIEGTRQLAEQAVKAGIKRIVFLSSIKVNGESNEKKKYSNKIFTHNDIPDPKDYYATSKFEAENVLWEVSAKTGLEVVVLRLPLVYGKGVKGNLMRLIQLVNSGVPLPLGMVNNQRSMIGIDNLVDLIIRCIDHPDAAGKTFLVSDGEDLSTSDLINHLASSMHRKSRLFPFPIFLLKFLSFIFGKQKDIDRLVGSLKVDSSYVQKILNWTPPVSVAEGIRRMVQIK